MRVCSAVVKRRRREGVSKHHLQEILLLSFQVSRRLHESTEGNGKIGHRAAAAVAAGIGGESGLIRRSNHASVEEALCETTLICFGRNFQFIHQLP